MPIVYLPLGSKAASGMVGEMVVYQGTTVRKYVVPTDPRTEAQLDIRHQFADITKTYRAAGLWFRAAWKGQIGARWYTQLLGRVTENGNERWNEAEAIYDTFSEPNKAAWGLNAPWAATWNDPGLVFWVCYYVSYQWLNALGAGWLDLHEPLESEAVDLAAEWVKELDGVLIGGMHDQTESFLNWSVGWETIVDGQAYGGSYKQTISSGAKVCTFYFYGSKVQIVGKAGPNLGTLYVLVDNVLAATIEQNQSEVEYQKVWTVVVEKKGLHYCEINGTYSPTANIDAIGIVTNPTKTSIPKVTGQVLEIGVIELAQQGTDPVAPPVGFMKVYTKADGALYALGQAGTVKTAFVEPASSAEVTAGAETAKYIAPKALKDAGIVVVTLPVKATGAEVTAGTDDAKFATPKALADAGIIVTPSKATGAEVTTGTNDAKFATPKALADAGVQAGLATPQRAGTAAAGTSVKLAKDDHVHPADGYGVSVLASAYDITAAAGTWVDTGLSITLTVGTWLVWADVRVYLVLSGGSVGWIAVKLYNSTDAADVANSERLGVTASALNISYGLSTHISTVITVTGTKTIKLYVKRDGTGTPTFSGSLIGSSADGRTALGYRQIS